MKGLLVTLLVLAPLAACESVGDIGGAGAPGAPGNAVDAGIAAVAVGSGKGGAGGSTVTTAASGMPCDVQAVFASRCVSCHSSPPVGGAPMALVTYANLTAPDPSDPTKTVAEAAVARMGDSARPMPPLPGSPAAATQITTVSSWIAAGYPMGTCDGGGADGGAGGAGDAGDPYGMPPTCTSGTTYAGGEGSSVMDPGQACISCHASSGGEAPRFGIAGTIYPTAHEPDLCYGADGRNGAQVVVTDANGKIITLTPNAAGNFYYSGSVTTPIRAKVTYMGRERIMSAAQTTADCNGCHTQNGANSAPGRIMLP